jgi:hypothetical protein
MEQQRNSLFPVHGFVVNGNFDQIGINFEAWTVNQLSFHPYSAFGNVLFRPAPGTDACPGQDLLQSFFHCRVTAIGRE